MHCPQCGLQQVSDKVRYCRSCGFSLSGVKELVLPDERAAKATKTRFETAFNQGLVLLLCSLLAAIILTLLKDAGLIPQIYVKIVAAFFVLAGLARMFYPYVVGKSKEREAEDLPVDKADAALKTSKLPLSLGSSRSIPVSDFDVRRDDKAEMMPPPSVTEHTTNKLNRREKSGTSGDLAA